MSRADQKNDGNVSYLYCPIWQPHVAVEYLNVAGETEELNFKCSLKLKFSHIWLVVTILDSTVLERVENLHLV